MRLFRRIIRNDYFLQIFSDAFDFYFFILELNRVGLENAPSVVKDGPPEEYPQCRTPKQTPSNLRVLCDLPDLVKDF